MAALACCNLLGAKFGKGVYMDMTDITEFDCVDVGDYVELSALVLPADASVTRTAS